MGGRNSGRFFVGRLLMGSALMAGLAGAGVLAVGAGSVSSTVGASSSCTASWPMYQHDAGHSADASGCSTVNTTTVATLHPKWFTQTAGQVTATPTVVGGIVYVGDGNGIFYAFDQATGTTKWTFDTTTTQTCVNGTKSTTVSDHHTGTSYGKITSTAAVADGRVFFGAGGTLWALSTHPSPTNRCLWAQDLDPANPASPMEVESSPVINAHTVIVGSDTNESSGSEIGKPGVQAFNVNSGAFKWKFEPENPTVQPDNLTSSNTDGCGGVWGSPALDTSAGPNGLVFFGTSNCNNPGQQTQPKALQWEGAWAINAANGHFVWNYQEPPNAYTNAGNSNLADDDIGSSPIVAHLNPGPDLVIFASKTGYAYGLNEATGPNTSGAPVWLRQAAQPGQLGQGVAALGGFIGSGALGTSCGTSAVFLTSAVFTPFNSDGIQPQAPPFTPDTSIANDPLRLASVHAINAATGVELWHAALSTPTYAAATYTNGVVFAPSTTGFDVEAYSADTGIELWRFPTAAPESSGVSMAGSDVFYGSGTYAAAPTVGVWDLTTLIP